MRAAELTMCRTFAVHFDHGDDFYTALAEFCAEYDVRQGFIPMFIAGLGDVQLAGACEKLENPDAPVWSSVTSITSRRSVAAPARTTKRPALSCPTSMSRSV